MRPRNREGSEVLVCPDVSEFQDALTAAYARDFLIFRCVDGSGYLDQKFLTNANEVAYLYAAKKLAGVIAYQVYRTVNVADQYNFFWRQMGPKTPPWLKGVMLDAESWGGEIRGDHSTPLNQLAGMHAHRMGWPGVLGYGNQADLAALWPHRDPRIRVIVASYSSKLIVSNVKGAIGQQYTDGSGRWPLPKGLTASTAPFGNADHNVFPGHANGLALAAALQPPKVVPKPVVTPAKPKPVPVVLYDSHHDNALVSKARHHGLFLTDDGNLELHHDGRTIWQTNTKGK